MSRGRVPAVGRVVEIALPNGVYAYGRVMLDSSVAFYRSRSLVHGRPPIGEPDPEFVVGVSEGSLRSLPVVGEDPFGDPEDAWPPPEKVQDPLTGGWRIYHRGEFRRATAEECEGLETAAVWSLGHIMRRLGVVGQPTPERTSEPASGFSRLSEGDGDWQLAFRCGDLPADAAVVGAGHEPNGSFWDRIAAIVAPDLVDRLDFDSEAGMFCAYGDRLDLERLQAALEPVLASPDEAARLLSQAEAGGATLDD